MFRVQREHNTSRTGLLRRWRKKEQKDEAQQARQEAERDSDSDASGSSRPSSSCRSDVENDMFGADDTRSLDLSATPASVHQDKHHDNINTVPTPALPEPCGHSNMPPAVLVCPPDTPPGQRQQQEGGGAVHVRHKSDSDTLRKLHSPPSPSPLSHVRFVERGVQATARAAAPIHCVKKAAFKVKYTKVYGEGDGAYRNDTRPRGLVFVCNFESFEGGKYTPRDGSEKDYNNLVSLFSQMGYFPEYRRGRYCLTGRVSRDQFMRRMRGFAAEGKHKDLCSCVVILMSHGTGPRTFVTSDNHEVDLLDVYTIFDNISCPNLKDKPKIFILQFCRGREKAAAASAAWHQATPPPLRSLEHVNVEELKRIVEREVSLLMREYQMQPPATKGDNNHALQQLKERSRAASLTSLLEPDRCGDGDNEAAAEDGGGGVGVGRGTSEVDGSPIAAAPTAGLQRYSDMYSIFSTSPGELSHRHPARGSLLIQAICHVFAEYAYQDDIDNLVRRVSTYMSKTLQKDDPISVPRQTCERTNNGLDKLFYFNPCEMVHKRQFTI